MDDTYLLIIWEEVPEDTDLYLVPWNVYLDNQKVIDEAAGHAINNVDGDAALGLMRLVYTAKNGGDDCTGLLDQYKLSDEDKLKPFCANIQKVVLSGFIL